MADNFLAEIRIFPINFAPVGWAFCDGQILPISQNTALFALLGTTYGGNGTSNFALPNMQGNAPLHAGGSGGPGLTQRFEGETGGAQTVTLLQTEMPSHSHGVLADTDNTSNDPTNNAWGSGQKGFGNVYAAPTNPQVPMSPAATSIAGGNLPHNNLQPFLTMNFCIALQGIFPTRA